MTGAGAEEHSSRRDLVDAPDGMSSNRSYARTWYRDSGTDFDLAGVGRGQCECGVAVRPDHLRIGNPGSIVAEFFCVPDEVPLADMGINCNSEFHFCLHVTAQVFSIFDLHENVHAYQRNRCPNAVSINDSGGPATRS